MSASNGNESTGEPQQDGSHSARAFEREGRSPAGFGPAAVDGVAGAGSEARPGRRPAAFGSAANGAESAWEAQRRRVPAAFGSALGAESEAPLRSRSGGVNKPRLVVPTPVLAAEALRLAESASGKRARKLTAFGLPAVVLAASGVAVLPTVANAAQAPSTACPAGTHETPNPAAGPNGGSSGGAPSSSPSSAPVAKAGAAGPGVPLPTSVPTTAPTSGSAAKPPAQAPTGPSGTATPSAPVPTGTSTPKPSTPPSSSTPAKPSSPGTTPSPSSSATWWDPLTWLGTTVNQVFNPPPAAGSSTANQLAAAPPPTPSSSPTSSATPILGLSLGGPTSSSSSKPGAKPSSKPSSAPSSPSTSPSTSPTSAPSTSQPTSSASSPSAPTSSSSPVTINGTPLPSPASTVCVQGATDQPFPEILWHLNASKLTLTNQKFLGFQEVATGDGHTVTVMAVHADMVDLTDMVTYATNANALAGGKVVFANGGKGKNVHLTNVTLHVLQQKGTLVSPVPLGPVTLGPPGYAGTDPASVLVMLLLEANLPLMPPSVFTDVHVDQFLMRSDTLSIPGFNIEPQP
ncbi:MAG: hypothetical protein ACJ786_25900 [Catenulispora sp.]